MSASSIETTVHQLLQTIRPWLPQEEAYLIDLAKTDMKARLLLAIMLAESEETGGAETLLTGILQAEGADQDVVRRACLELAQLRMDELKYDEAEDFLWKARNELSGSGDDEIAREAVSLLIAECRFGQGFVQEAIDRAEEVLRKQLSIGSDDATLARTHQQLGWFKLHKMDVPGALEGIKTAMRLAPSLDRELVDAAIEAERDGNFEKAVEYYYDSIRFES